MAPSARSRKISRVMSHPSEHPECSARFQRAAQCRSPERQDKRGRSTTHPSVISETKANAVVARCPTRRRTDDRWRLRRIPSAHGTRIGGSGRGVRFQQRCLNEDAHSLGARVPQANAHISRDVDRGPGADRDLTRAKPGNATPAMDEEDFLSVWMVMEPNLLSGRNVLHPHEEARRLAVLSIDLDDKGRDALGAAVSPGPPHTQLALRLLKDESGGRRRGGIRARLRLALGKRGRIRDQYNCADDSGEREVLPIDRQTHSQFPCRCCGRYKYEERVSDVRATVACPDPTSRQELAPRTRVKARAESGPQSAERGEQPGGREASLWLRCIVAWVITVALLIALIAYVDNEALTKELHGWFRIAFGSVTLWFVFGPMWSLRLIRPRQRNDAWPFHREGPVPALPVRIRSLTESLLSIEVLEVIETAVHGGDMALRHGEPVPKPPVLAKLIEEGLRRRRTACGLLHQAHCLHLTLHFAACHGYLHARRFRHRLEELADVRSTPA